MLLSTLRTAEESKIWTFWEHRKPRLLFLFYLWVFFYKCYRNDFKCAWSGSKNVSKIKHDYQKNIIYMQQRRLLTETESFGKKEKIATKVVWWLVMWPTSIIILSIIKFFLPIKMAIIAIYILINCCELLPNYGIKVQNHWRECFPVRKVCFVFLQRLINVTVRTMYI